MTNRLQILRSSVTGNTPTAGTRAAGELFVNFADFQLGMIDASRNAQRLVAVRYFSTGANYVAGDFVIQAGALYVAKGAITAGAFSAAQWTKVAAATDAGGPYLALAGGTLTGALVLAADPGAALGAATKQYVDGKVSAAPFLPLAGGTMLAPIVLSGPPTIPLHAATKAYVDAGAFVPVGGGTMTGDLILNRDAQVALGAATKQQVDARGAGDNRIINGDMRIDQRNGGAGGTATGVYTADRWWYNASQPSKGTWQRTTAGPSLQSFGFGNTLQFTSSSAYTPGAAENFQFMQKIEADMVSDFAWGTSGAQPVTLSFFANCSLSGTFGGSIGNDTNNRSYPFSYSLVAGTWTKIAITIPGDTGGTWVMAGNATSVVVHFDLGAGSNLRGPVNVWASVNYVGATGAVSVVATNAATFYVTGVKLEIGSVATPYNRQSVAKSMADCQRYYQTSGNVCLEGYSGAASSTVGSTIWFQAQMRAFPTLVTSGATYSNSSALAFDQITQNVCRALWTGSSIGRSAISGISISLSAEL